MGNRADYLPLGISWKFKDIWMQWGRTLQEGNDIDGNDCFIINRLMAFMCQAWYYEKVKYAANDMRMKSGDPI